MLSLSKQNTSNWDFWLLTWFLRLLVDTDGVMWRSNKVGNPVNVSYPPPDDYTGLVLGCEYGFIQIDSNKRQL